MTGGVRASARAKQKARMWVGDRERVLRIVDAIEEVLGDRGDRAEQAVIDANNARRYPWDGESFEREKRVARESWQVRATAVEPDMAYEQTGPVRTVLEKVDPSVVESLVLTVPGDALISNTLMLRMSNDGVVLSIEDEDRELVRSLEGRVWSEVKKGRPWWRLFRHGLTVAALGLLAFVVLVVAAARVVSGPAPASYWNTAAALWWFGFAAGAFSIDWALKRWMPAFEMRSWSEARGQFTAKVVAGALLAVPIAGLVNWGTS